MRDLAERLGFRIDASSRDDFALRYVLELSAASPGGA